MDKLNVALMSAICFLLCVSAAVVHGVWFSKEAEDFSVSTPPQIEEERNQASIAMNEEAQVINGGSENMWVRVRVDGAGSKADANWPERGCQLVSDTIIDHPSAAEAREGIWTRDADGYYYYSLPVPPGERSKPLFESVRASAGAKGLKADSVKVQAEAVQVNWISKTATSGKEAFSLYQLYQPLQEQKGQLL